jgi:hypothetical protein
MQYNGLPPFKFGTELQSGNGSTYYGAFSPPGSQEEAEQDEEEYLEACPGSFEEPKVGKPGILCIYLGPRVGAFNPPSSILNQAWVEEAHEFGITIPFEITSKEAALWGTWAVGG